MVAKKHMSGSTCDDSGHFPPMSESMSSGMPENIRQKIAQMAYFKAEQRGFMAGCEMDDWLEAEREVMEDEEECHKMAAC